MTIIDAKLRIGAQVDQALGVLRGLRREIAGVDADSRKPAPGAFGGLRSGAADVAAQLRTARNALLALVGAQLGTQGVRSVAELADGYAGLTARLRIATRGEDEYRLALARTRALSIQYQQPLRETATLYTRVLSAVRPLGGGLQEADTATRALLASLRLSGATTAESASAILQFSQALGAGALRGEEFNAINEAAPELLTALAAGLGRGREELKGLAEQGQLTTSAILGALQKALPQLERNAASLPRTIGGAVQEVRNSLLEFVGTTTEGSAGVAALTTAILALARNIGPLINLLVSLGGVLLALKLGAVVSGFLSLAVGVGGVTAVLPALLSGLRALLVLVGGPVGLVVALASLAAGWNLVSEAKRKSRDRTLELVQSERDAAQAELDVLDAESRKNNFYGNAAARQEAAYKLQRLDAELAAMRRRNLEEFRRGELGSATEPGSTTLRDPRTVQDFKAKYQTQAATERQFREERIKFEIAADKDIAAARAAGNTALEAQLLAEKKAAVDEQLRAEKEALGKFGADQRVTRIAQYKAEFDATAAVSADATQRELERNQELFDAQLRSAKDYFAERRRLEALAADQAVAGIQAEIAARERVLRQNQARRAGDANARAGFDDAITADRSAIAELQAQLAQADAARRQANESRLLQERQVTTELERQRAVTALQIRAENEQLTLADVRSRVEAEFAEQRRREVTDTGSAELTDALVATRVRIESLQLLLQQYQTLAETVRITEASIAIEVERGTITVEEGERRKLAARLGALPQLRELQQQIAGLSSTDGERNRAAELGNELQRMQQGADELTRSLRGSLGSGFGQLFTDIATGARTAGEAFQDFLLNVARSALNLIGQQLGQQLATSLLPGGGAGGGGAGFWATAAQFAASFFHQGGIAGAAGGVRRGVPISAFALAPRYHSGGIGGLRPNEVPAVLERGEEVLTADDPRHIKNYRGGMGDVAIEVNVTGASGDATTNRRAGGELARAVEQAIGEWAINQQRPGGILAGR